MKLFTVLPFLIISQGAAFQTRCCLGRIRFGPSCTSMERDVTRRALSRLSMQSTKQRHELCTVFGLSETSKGAASVLLGASLFLSVPPAIGADYYHGGSSPPPDASVLMGEYSDLDENGRSFHFSGTDLGLLVDDGGVSRGWSPGEILNYPLLGTEERLDGNVMLRLPGLQLSNGYGDDKGVWKSPINSVIEPNMPSKAVDGLTKSHDDETTGIKKETKKPLSTVIGEWIFLAYIGFSTLAGVKGVWDKIQEKRNRAL
jgi:hypothetical protein